MTEKNDIGNGLAPTEQDVIVTAFTAMEEKLFENIHESLNYLTSISVEIFEKYRSLLQGDKENYEPKAGRVSRRIVQLDLIIALKKSGF